MRKKVINLITVFIILVNTAPAQLSQKKYLEWNQMHISKDSALVEFNNAKFGLFIHWGLYSALAAEWQGNRIPGLSEWIMYHAKISRADYGNLAKQFNPIEFNAEQWVQVAKSAGMKYIVITAKHHDGFSMYDTKYSDYNIIKATPYKHDPIDELYHECKKQGIRFGVYYSQIIDWWDGWDGGMLNSDRKVDDMNIENPMNTWDPAKTTREKYLKNKAFPQIKELIKKYPDMQEVWFDYWYEGKGDKFCNPGISFDFYKILYKVTPQCLVSSRIGSGLGDFQAAGDNEILSKSKMIFWETPGTVNNTWGYSKFDNDFKTPEEILFWLVDIASKGGNYLLNIGPKADGSIPQESLDLLRETGKWMAKNSKSIYGTKKWLVSREGPNAINMFGTDDRANEGFKPNFTSEDFWFTAKDGAVYVNTFKRPSDGIMKIKAFSKGNQLTSNIKIKSINLLGCNETLKWEQTSEALNVQIPESSIFQYGDCIEILY